MRVDWAGREESEGGRGAYEDDIPVDGEKRKRKKATRAPFNIKVLNTLHDWRLILALGLR